MRESSERPGARTIASSFSDAKMSGIQDVLQNRVCAAYICVFTILHPCFKVPKGVISFEIKLSTVFSASRF